MTNENQSGSDNPPKLVLLVDGGAERVLDWRQKVAAFGVECLHGTTGQEALNLIGDREVALIMLGARMTEPDGFDTGALLRSSRRTRDVPMLVLESDGGVQRPCRRKATSRHRASAPQDPEAVRRVIQADATLLAGCLDQLSRPATAAGNGSGGDGMEILEPLSGFVASLSSGLAARQRPQVRR